MSKRTGFKATSVRKDAVLVAMEDDEETESS